MNDIERYLDEVCRTLGGSRDLREHIREELRDHLADAVDACLAKGLSREEATKKAMADFGRPEETRSGLESLYGHSVTAFLIDRAMSWKERNMKSGWKWSFAAMTMLVIVMVSEFLLSLTFMVFIYPKLTENFQLLGEPLPLLPAKCIEMAQFLRSASLIWLIAVGLFVAWALFEWRVKSENKAVIRLTCAACLTLLITAASVFTSLATVVGLAEAASLNYLEDPKPYAESRYADAAAAVANLQAVVPTKDRQKVLLACQALQEVILDLKRPRVARALVPDLRPLKAQRVQSLADSIWRDTWPICAEDKWDALADVEKDWSELVKEVGHSPAVPQPPAAPPAQPST